MMLGMHLWHYELDGPLGPMWAAFDERGRLRQLRSGSLDPRATMPLAPVQQREVFKYLVRQLDAYFEGTLRTFTVPLEPGGDAFQQRVWDEVLTIPHGEILPIDKLVLRLGGAALRETTAALAANPILIILPAHRVLWGPGTEASGLQATLLEHERRGGRLEER